MKTILLTDDSFASALAEAKRVLMAGGGVIALFADLLVFFRGRISHVLSLHSQI